MKYLNAKTIICTCTTLLIGAALSWAQPSHAQTKPDSNVGNNRLITPTDGGGVDGPGTCGAGGSCYTTHGPGCDNTACCQQVCAVDPFCCNNSWDSICVNEALQMCGNCGGSNAGSCCVANGTPGCNDGACCATVCPADPYCCDVQWDSICADEAASMCGGLCGPSCGSPGSGSCCVAHSTPFCDNSACCNTVCNVDPYCCNTEWDSICVGEAQDMCGNLCLTCGNPNAGSCYSAHPNPYCDNADCCNAVCAVDPYCCNTEWDSICAGEAADMCTHCGNPNSGDCCVAHAGTGCNNGDCCNTVCAVDPYCCNTEWDSICADEAQDMCGNLCVSCGSPGAGSCYSAHANPFCDNAACCETVCAVDPYCCNNQWDQICANEAAQMCGNCGGPNAGPCGVAHATPGCAKGSCCAAVCAIDSYCCDVQWDSICVGEAVDLCVGPCPGDITGDGVVNVNDLLQVINNWGPCSGCPADIAPPAGDNLVNVNDLLKVINTWGPCPQASCTGWTCNPPPSIEVCPPGNDPNCFCWSKYGGGTVCAYDFFCDKAPDCADGVCPTGTTCVILSCCGVNKCAPLCANGVFAPPVAEAGDHMGSGVVAAPDKE